MSTRRKYHGKLHWKKKIGSGFSFWRPSDNLRKLTSINKFPSSCIFISSISYASNVQGRWHRHSTFDGSTPSSAFWRFVLERSYALRYGHNGGIKCMYSEDAAAGCLNPEPLALGRQNGITDTRWQSGELRADRGHHIAEFHSATALPRRLATGCRALA